MKIRNWKLKIKIPIIILTLILAAVISFQFEFGNSKNDDSTAYIGPQIAPLKFDDKSIEFPYTDDTNQETLIIKSDKKSYVGFSNTEAYFSVTNTSDIDETAVLLFYFPSVYIPTSRDDPSGVGPATIASVEQRQGNQWQKLKFFSKNIKIDENLLGKAISKRKPIPNDFAMKAGTQITIAAGQTLYFRSKINFPPGNDGEFWIESLGKNGGYGLLDPFYSSSWTYRKKITIDHFKVSGSSDLSNFPVLISVTDPNLKTTANGGKAASGSGEFVFTSSDGTTVLPHEIETYSATTGQFIGWVNVTTLSATNDTYLYIYYGGPAAGGATNQNKTGTWDANYGFVGHLKDGTTLSLTDSTSNANNGTGTATPTATTGQVDGGLALVSASSQYVSLSDSAALSPGSGDFTFSAWVKTSSLDSTQRYIYQDYGTDTNNLVFMSLSTSNKLRVYYRDSGGNAVDTSETTALSTGVWYYLVGVRNGTTGRVYLNGVQENTNTNALLATITTSASDIPRIGASFVGSALNFWNGSMDEIRMSKTARSADWIKTEYNNQSSPSTFVGYGGAEVNIRTSASIKYGSITSTDSVASWFASGSQQWSNRKKISINKSKVSGGANLSNFPILFSVTDSTLATTANGGKAASGSGEFVFTSSDGTTVLPHEIETYSATTGQFIGWVNVTTLSATNDTNIYIYYGGPAAGGASNQNNRTGVWDSNFKAVYHLPNGTSLTALDSTNNAANGTITAATAIAGQVDGGGSFNGTSAKIVTGAATMPADAFTVEAWINPSSLTNGKAIFEMGDPTDADQVLRFISSKLAVISYYTDNAHTDTPTIGGTTLSTNTWYHVVWTRTTTLHTVYVNGVSDGTSAPGGATAYYGAGTKVFNLGDRNGASFYAGTLDEPRISNTARSAGWIKTEYNNQSSPSTFYALGGLEARIPANPGLKIKGGVRFR